MAQVRYHAPRCTWTPSPMCESAASYTTATAQVKLGSQLPGDRLLSIRRERWPMQARKAAGRANRTGSDGSQGTGRTNVLLASATGGTTAPVVHCRTRWSRVSPTSTGAGRTGKDRGCLGISLPCEPVGSCESGGVGCHPSMLSVASWSQIWRYAEQSPSALSVLRSVARRLWPSNGS